jgi:hypothetical protein
VFKMMEVSRHKSVDTLRGYVRRADLFKEHAARRSCDHRQRSVLTTPQAQASQSGSATPGNRPVPTAPRRPQHPRALNDTAAPSGRPLWSLQLRRRAKNGGACGAAKFREETSKKSRQRDSEPHCCGAQSRRTIVRQQGKTSHCSIHESAGQRGDPLVASGRLLKPPV